MYKTIIMRKTFEIPRKLKRKHKVQRLIIIFTSKFKPILHNRTGNYNNPTYRWVPILNEKTTFKALRETKIFQLLVIKKQKNVLKIELMTVITVT